MKDFINRIIDLFRLKKNKQYLNLNLFIPVPMPDEERPVLRLMEKIIISRDNEIPKKYLIGSSCQKILANAKSHIFIDRQKDPKRVIKLFIYRLI